MVDATIQFNTNGGNDMPEIITNIRDGFTLPEPPTKANHTFVGWYLDAALTQPFDVNQFNYLSFPDIANNQYIPEHIGAKLFYKNISINTNYADDLCKYFVGNAKCTPERIEGARIIGN